MIDFYRFSLLVKVLMREIIFSCDKILVNFVLMYIDSIGTLALRNNIISIDIFKLQIAHLNLNSQIDQKYISQIDQKYISQIDQKK